MSFSGSDQRTAALHQQLDTRGGAYAPLALLPIKGADTGVACVEQSLCPDVDATAMVAAPLGPASVLVRLLSELLPYSLSVKCNGGKPSLHR